MSPLSDMRSYLEEAMALHQRGEKERAEAMYREVLKDFPTEPNALHLLGALAWQRGDLTSAEAHIRAAIRHNPGVAAYHLNLGGVLREKGDLPGAIAEYEAALQRAPNDETPLKELAQTLHRYGAALMGGYKVEAAKAVFRRALEIDPDNVPTLNNLAMLLQHEGDRHTARQLFDRGLKRMPDHQALRYNRSINALTDGRLEEGWEDFAASERHWRTASDPWSHLPLWDGSDVSGKRILVWGDQGIGDEILYASLIPDLIARQAVVTIECNPRLAPLFKRSFPACEILPRGSPPPDTEIFDWQAPDMWLARCLRPNKQAFPKRRSFLQADIETTCRLRERYERAARKRILGLSWFTSSPNWGLVRSVPLPEMLAPLDLDDLLIVDLQYGNTADAWRQAGEMFPSLKVVSDPEIDQLTNMDDFAAQIAACDHVLTIGNTTAHLAGALGVPGAVILPDQGLTWYWFETDETCLWYPSLTLWRPDIPDRLQRAAHRLAGVNA